MQQCHLANASEDISKALVKRPPLALALARCRQPHFINFLTAAIPNRIGGLATSS